MTLQEAAKNAAMVAGAVISVGLGLLCLGAACALALAGRLSDDEEEEERRLAAGALRLSSNPRPRERASIQEHR